MQVNQRSFEPWRWARPVHEQIWRLQGYLPDAAVDPDYLKRRLAARVSRGFTRVAVPKFTYLQTCLGLTDVYEQIGQAIEDVGDRLQAERGDRFRNCRQGKLGPDAVRCHEQAVERRRAAEKAIPGHILLLEVDLGNRTLGGRQTCQAPCWSREVISRLDYYLCLSAADVGWILLLNERRLTRPRHLGIDCTFEECPWPGRDSVGVPYWSFVDGQLRLDIRMAVHAYPNYAAGLALIPSI